MTFSLSISALDYGWENVQICQWNFVKSPHMGCWFRDMNNFRYVNNSVSFGFSWNEDNLIKYYKSALFEYILSVLCVLKCIIFCLTIWMTTMQVGCCWVLVSIQMHIITVSFNSFTEFSVWANHTARKHSIAASHVIVYTNIFSLLTIILIYLCRNTHNSRFL